MGSLALLILRLTVGTIMAGHGSQKLFGWFGGSGLEGTRGWLESMGLRPGRPWALSASLSEFGGGVLMLLGLLNPVGALGVIGAMSMATAKAHWGKPIWVSKGGAELPLINTSAALAIALAGSGRYSLDGLLGIRLPRWLLIPGLLGVAASVFFGVTSSQQPEAGAPDAGDEPQEEAAGA